MFVILGQLVLLTGCLSNFETEEKPITIWKYTDYSKFNTVSNIYSYKGETEEEFQQNVDKIAQLLEEYHKLFDIYYEYSGVVNLCTVNKNAGKDPLEVDQKLIDFLLYAKEIYKITNGETNVMLGSVLKIWHDARTVASADSSKAYVPNIKLLEEASKYTSIDLLEIDDEKNTVRITDANARIDVGALGKGYATEKVAQFLEDSGCSSYVLDIGGNLRVIGTKTDGTGWNTGIRNPLGNTRFSLYLNISDTSCVTSGDYERYYVFEGKKYHHIIDKDTLMPADYFSSITILTKDSGLADALSTALFAMPYEDGRKLVDSLEGVETVWIYKDGTIVYTDGVTPINLES